VASSASLNLRGCPKISLVQSQQESGLLSSPGYFNWRHSPCNFIPKLYGLVLTAFHVTNWRIVCLKRSRTLVPQVKRR
jgi:hypothetical protein